MATSIRPLSLQLFGVDPRAHERLGVEPARRMPRPEGLFAIGRGQVGGSKACPSIDLHTDAVRCIGKGGQARQIPLLPRDPRPVGGIRSTGLQMFGPDPKAACAAQCESRSIPTTSVLSLP